MLFAIGVAQKQVLGFLPLRPDAGAAYPLWCRPAHVLCIGRIYCFVEQNPVRIYSLFQCSSLLLQIYLEISGHHFSMQEGKHLRYGAAVVIIPGKNSPRRCGKTHRAARFDQIFRELLPAFLPNARNKGGNAHAVLTQGQTCPPEQGLRSPSIPHTPFHGCSGAVCIRRRGISGFICCIVTAGAQF